MAAAGIGIYLFIVLRSRYADDFHYFFDINALADVELGRTGSFLLQLFQHGMWIDRILYPAGLAVLLLSLVWLRQLWRNPLFTASWIAFAGDAIYILRRQDDYAPRYFLVMLVPLILVPGHYLAGTEDPQSQSGVASGGHACASPWCSIRRRSLDS